MAEVRYVVTPADPRAHLFEVSCIIERPDPAGQVFRLPSWIRGSYLVRDLAKHIVQLKASGNGQPLAVERLDKRSLRCAPTAGPLRLDYSVYAYDESVRKAYLDTRRGFFNGSSLFYCPAGHENSSYVVEISKPGDPACREWKLATAMTPQTVDARGFGHYRAAGYEELIDHPVEMSAFERLDFGVDGVPHSLVLSGRYQLDRERVVRDLAKVCHVQREMFGQEPKLDHFLFLTNVVGAGYGGLEHRASTALTCSRNDLPRPGQNGMPREYRTFLGLCSHEYFHLWNVKRITAERFLESDLAAEAYTQDLWHYEGVTSYYDDLTLLRAGLLEAPVYLDVLAETATRLQRMPGRLVHTLVESSFETWIKYYQPDENSLNATVNYYIKGALTALCLDLYLRLHSAVTLDDIMRALWQQYGRQGEGMPEGGLEQAATEVSGLDLAPQFDRWLRSTEELPLAGLLAEFGVDAKLRAAVSEADPGGRINGKPAGASLGLRLKPGEATVAHVLAGGGAQRAGVSAGDVLVALDGLKVMAGSWPLRLAALAPGREYALHFFRGDELMTATLAADALPADTWTFTLMEAPGEKLLRRKAWLGY